MKKRQTTSQSGFTLIEMIIVVTIVGILAGIAIVHVQYAQRKAEEAVLKADLHQMRKAIDDFYADKQRYPNDLNELVPHYLRKIPPDPITNKTEWDVKMDDPNDPNAPPDASGGASNDATNPAASGPGIIDVKSKAPGKTIENVPYTEL